MPPPDRALQRIGYRVFQLRYLLGRNVGRSEPPAAADRQLSARHVRRQSVRPYKRQILAGLNDAGWELITVDADVPEWWCDEQWLLESRRASFGRQLFVTFVVDPQWDGIRKPGQGIEAIWASREPLDDWNDATSAISTLWMSKRHFDRKLTEFLASIRAFQEQVA